MEITAKEILRLIEQAPPNNQSALDEINDKVCIYLMGISRHQYLGNSEYCSSRDALKGIRPEGYVSGAFPETSYGAVEIGLEFHGFCQSDNMAFETQIDFDPLPTEELAELHAIIQAIEHDRNRRQPIAKEGE